MGHAEVIPAAELLRSSGDIFYLPAHGVVKESSTTIKLRIVYDARSSSCHSLNDVLLPGPSLYPLLSTIINRFRLHQIGLVGDISKMFREISLNPADYDSADYDLHRFLHQDTAGNIIDCRIRHLTFGITSSPYLASLLLHQLASDYRGEYPRAAKLISEALYVDDCLTEADSPQYY